MLCPGRRPDLTLALAWVGLFCLMVVTFGCAPRSQTVSGPGYPAVSDETIPHSEPDIDLMSELAAVYAQVRREPAPSAVLAEADAVAQEAQLLYLLGQTELAEEMLIQAIALLGDTGNRVGVDGSPGDEFGSGDRSSRGDRPDR